MKQGTTYKREQAFALLLIGEPKSGKTTFAMSFPRPFVLDLDNNLAGALRHHGDEIGAKDFFFDDLEDVKAENKWKESMKALDEACSSPDVDTIIVDGLSIMAEYLQTHILNSTNRDSNSSKLVIAGENCMQMTHWTPFKNLMAKLVMACKSSGKKFIMICHEQPIENDNGAVVGYRPLIQGSLRNNIAGYFTDVWRCESGVKAKKPYHRVRFAPKSLMQIGNSLGIKEEDYDVTGKTKNEIWNYLTKFF